MRWSRYVWWIALKDLQIERRTGEVVSTTALFGFVTVVLTSLAFYLTPVLALPMAAGVIWTALTFCGVLALNKSWAREREWSAFYSLWLSPAPPSAIYVGKVISMCCFMAVVIAFLLPLVALFFHLELNTRLLPLLLLLLLGSIGLAAPGTLFAAMSLRTSSRELMLSIVLFPLIMPALLGGVVATRELLAGASLLEVSGWLRILSAFDLIFLVVGGATFGRLLKD